MIRIKFVRFRQFFSQCAPQWAKLVTKFAVTDKYNFVKFWSTFETSLYKDPRFSGVAQIWQISLHSGILDAKTSCQYPASFNDFMALWRYMAI